MLYEGTTSGQPYFPLDGARLRFLGGSSNHWGGWTRPLDPHDFEPKAHHPLSGWPISKSDLYLYAADADAILNLPQDMPAPDIMPEAVADLLPGLFRFSRPTARFGVIALHRRTEGGSGPLPSWVNRIDTFGSVPAFGVGLALNVRPKALLLAAAASLVIRGENLGGAEGLVVIAVYTAVATSTVSVPTVLTLLFPQRMESRLNAARRWLTDNGLLITAVVMILIGVVIAGAGLGNL